MDGFASLCEQRGEGDHAHAWRDRSRELAAVVEREGWDGGWYRRAYDDGGKPWGSSSSECRIDSIAQSWAVLSGAARPEQDGASASFGGSVLLREDQKLLRFFLWPPFDATPRDPGYIKAYPPGIRENGGQYTHAAAWLAFSGLCGSYPATGSSRCVSPSYSTRSRTPATEATRSAIGSSRTSSPRTSPVSILMSGVAAGVGTQARQRRGAGRRLNQSHLWAAEGRRRAANEPGFPPSGLDSMRMRTEGGVLRIEVENPGGSGPWRRGASRRRRAGGWRGG